MTDQELRFRELQETRRHNAAMEALQGQSNEEVHRTNVENEGIKRESNLITSDHYIRSDSENVRHNVASEGIETSKVNESVRHNKVSEDIESGKLRETVRHNTVSEGIESRKVDESVRHNKADEQIQNVRNTETQRHNIVSEAISAYNLEPEREQMQAKTNESNAHAGLYQAQDDSTRLDVRKKEYTYPTETGKEVEENKRDAVKAAGDRQKADAQYNTGLNYDIGIVEQFGQIGKGVSDAISPITGVLRAVTDITKVFNVRK